MMEPWQVLMIGDQFVTGRKPYQEAKVELNDPESTGTFSYAAVMIANKVIIAVKTSPITTIIGVKWGTVTGRVIG